MGRYSNFPRNIALGLQTRRYTIHPRATNQVHKQVHPPFLLIPVVPQVDPGNGLDSTSFCPPQASGKREGWSDATLTTLVLYTHALYFKSSCVNVVSFERVFFFQNSRIAYIRFDRFVQGLTSQCLCLERRKMFEQRLINRIASVVLSS